MQVHAKPVSAPRPDKQDMVTAGLDCFLEGRSDFSVEIRVDQRVERGVEVPYPEDCGYHHRRAITHLVSAQGRDDVPVMETHVLFNICSQGTLRPSGYRACFVFWWSRDQILVRTQAVLIILTPDGVKKVNNGWNFSSVLSKPLNGVVFKRTVP
jgi:hypothetical protein